MHVRIQDVLENRHANYLLPFFWQHGEEEPVLREEMARIHECGIGAVCVESRPHPDFCGPLWWRDMDIIMDEARGRGMQVWVLDDAHFPTGFANGWIRDKFPALKKVYLAERHLDVVGPQPGASVMIGAWVGDTDRLVAVVAVTRSATGQATETSPVELTPHVAGDRLHWDIPDGHWRIFIVVETPNGGGNPDYLNPIDAASCRVLIDAVYEPHYARYSSDFGKTFAGFFSDEPNIGNGGGLYDCAIGRKAMVLPWRAGLLDELAHELGGPVTGRLPGLWDNIGRSTWPVRYAYMNLVSRLYGRCFTDQIADWCTAHGVEYIGHIVEDNDAHTRLGAGVPHFFRALGGQTMSGIDVALWQVRPGFDQRTFTWQIEADADGEFFHYELGKLGASLAHVDPKKRGRAVCEIYGAYGWTEGLRLMKWLTDHMLVRGMNHFVPHAFSPKFPDYDCPPHFYARGKNPQYRYFRVLMEYASRVCHLLSNGRHVAEAAVLYHAEADWSGQCMSAKEPMRVLMQAQLDADIVPLDVLGGAAAVRQGKLVVGDEDYGCLVMPWAQRWPRGAMQTVSGLLDRGLKVACVQDWPADVTEGDEAGTLLAALRRHPNARVTALEQLPEVLRDWGLTGVRTADRQPYLRRYQYRHEGLAIWMFFNEDPSHPIKTSVYLDGARRVLAYDPFANQLAGVPSLPEDGGARVPLVLAPEESIIMLSGDVPQAPQQVRWSDARRIVPLAVSQWCVATADAEAYPQFTPWRTLDSPINLCQPGLLPDFSGTIAYETTFITDAPASGRVFLDLGEVGEVAQVSVNGSTLGVRLSRPYVFDVTGVLRPGENALRVEVTNTLVCAMKDELSRIAAQCPSGLVGPVDLRYVE